MKNIYFLLIFVALIQFSSDSYAEDEFRTVSDIMEGTPTANIMLENGAKIEGYHVYQKGKKTLKAYYSKALKKGGFIGKNVKVQGQNVRGKLVLKYAWISDNAVVSDNAQIGDNALISGNARVFGNAQVFGNARVSEDAWVFGNAQITRNAWVGGNSQVFGNAWVSGHAKISRNALISEDAWVFGHAEISGDAIVGGDAFISGNIRIFGATQIRGSASRETIRMEGGWSEVASTGLNEEDNCPICFDSFKKTSGRKLIKLNRCDHIYDVECMEEWLKQNDSCPLCSLSSKPVLR